MRRQLLPRGHVGKQMLAPSRPDLQGETGRDSLGFFATPDYPTPICYEERDCEWTIRAPKGYVIQYLLLQSAATLDMSDLQGFRAMEDYTDYTNTTWMRDMYYKSVD